MIGAVVVFCVAYLASVAVLCRVICVCSRIEPRLNCTSRTRYVREMWDNGAGGME
jgi:hypothetical protein